MSDEPRKWILVVDDNPGLRAVWVEVLEDAGYSVGASGDGLEAIHLVGILLPDLILLDLRMPRVSGWDFLGRLRANPSWERIPVLVISGHIEEGTAAVSGSPNVVGQLEKPVTIDVLLEAVQRALSTRSVAVS